MDYMKPFGCNCQNKVSPNKNPQMREQNLASCNKSCYNQKIEDKGYNKCESTDTLHDMPLAMCYVPWQTWKNVYDASNGLKKGTIFGELIYPFLFASPVCRENGNNYGRRCDMK